MPFVDTNSHLTTKPYNFDIKCQWTLESYDRHIFFGIKFGGGQNCSFTLGSFFNKREYSVGGWLDPLVLNLDSYMKKLSSEARVAKREDWSLSR